MEIIIYGLKNCDSCRRALKSLEGAKLVDVRADGLPDDILTRAMDEFGEALLNTRSTTWRGLEAGEKVRPPRELIKEHPALMKRPLILVDNSLFLSWNKDVESKIKALI